MYRSNAIIYLDLNPSTFISFIEMFYKAPESLFNQNQIISDLLGKSYIL